MSRLKPIPPEQLSGEQKLLYDEMQSGIKTSYQGVQVQRADGALIGPFNPWLHQPTIGEAIWNLNRTLAGQATLRASVFETVVLVVGRHFQAAYEVYSHLIFASKAGLTDEQLATILSGSRPVGLDEQEGCAYDVAQSLVRGGVLPYPCYQQALKLLGEKALAEIVYFAGFYALACMTMNAYDVLAPGANVDGTG